MDRHYLTHFSLIRFASLMSESRSDVVLKRA